MNNFVCTALETCHANDCAVSVYAYFRKEPTKADWNKALKSDCGGGLSLDPSDTDKWEDREEVPTTLSDAAGFKRYYLGGAG